MEGRTKQQLLEHYKRAWQSSEDRFRNIIESSADGILVVDLEGVVQFANPAAEILLGRPARALQGEPFGFPIVVGEATELDVVRQEGEHLVTRVVEMRVTETEWRQRKVYLASLRDVTERVGLAQALAWEAGVNAAMAELSTALISTGSLEEMSVLVLEHAQRLTHSDFGYVGYIDPQTGYLICPTMTRDIWEVCQVPDKSIVFERFGGLWGWVLENRQSMLTNAPDQDPRSTGIPMAHVPIRRFVSAPAIMEGQLLGQVALANPGRDYTQQDLALVERLANVYALAVARKRDESALRQSEEKFRSLFDSASDAIFIHDLEGRFLEVNRSACQRLGYSRQELLQMTPGDIDAPDYAALVPQRIEALRQDDQATFETVHVTRDSRSIPVELSSRVIEYAGQSAVLSLARDITERKQAEEALAQQARELARSNADLQQFAHVASHDLQEPLRMVTSYLQLLERRYRGQLDQEADEFINFAVEGALRMKSLIRGLLAYSRVDTRGQTLELVDSQAILERILHDLRFAIQESGAVVTYDPLPTVVADATQLGQLFQNLVDNAIKFRNQAPPRVHVSAERVGDAWRFALADNGIGIQAGQEDRIFMIFQRLHTQDEYPGTGVGLSICQKIVERHQGRIWVESQPGEGATFYFTLPIRPEDDHVSPMVRAGSMDVTE